MAKSNDSVAVTPGSGTTIATHLAASKEHQVVVLADSNGNLHGTRETFVVSSGNSANVAAARTTHVDIFNATGSGVVLVLESLLIIPTLTAVSGIGLAWEVIRTSAVGTGGTTLTPRPMDTTNAALPGGVTARSKPTGGATTDVAILFPNTSSEETVPYASLASSINHIPKPTLFSQPLVIRENQGLKLDQVTSSAVGSTNVVLIFGIL